MLTFRRCVQYRKLISNLIFPRQSSQHFPNQSFISFALAKVCFNVWRTYVCVYVCVLMSCSVQARTEKRNYKALQKDHGKVLCFPKVDDL